MRLENSFSGAVVPPYMRECSMCVSLWHFWRWEQENWGSEVCSAQYTLSNSLIYLYRNWSIKFRSGARDHNPTPRTCYPSYFWPTMHEHISFVENCSALSHLLCIFHWPLIFGTKSKSYSSHLFGTLRRLFLSISHIRNNYGELGVPSQLTSLHVILLSYYGAEVTRTAKCS